MKFNLIEQVRLVLLLLLIDLIQCRVQFELARVATFN